MLAIQGEGWRVDPAWADRLKPLGLDDHGRWSRFSDGEVASASRSTNSYKVTLSNGESVYFKRYVYSSLRLRSLFLPSKAAVEAWGLAQMARVGCSTPTLLAYGERRLLGNIRSAFLVTQAIDNSVSLADFAGQLSAPGAAEEGDISHWLRLISAQLIPQLQAMHGAGLFHYDLKWRNLLIEPTDSGCRVHLIDCPRARRHRWRKFRGQVVDLSALSRLAFTYLSEFQRLRFLLQYLNQGQGVDRAYTRKLLKAVNAHLSRRPPKGWQS